MSELRDVVEEPDVARRRAALADWCGRWAGEVSIATYVAREVVIHGAFDAEHLEHQRQSAYSKLGRGIGEREQEYVRVRQAPSVASDEEVTLRSITLLREVPR